MKAKNQKGFLNLGPEETLARISIIYVLQFLRKIDYSTNDGYINTFLSELDIAYEELRNANTKHEQLKMARKVAAFAIAIMIDILSKRDINND